MAAASAKICGSNGTPPNVATPVDFKVSMYDDPKFFLSAIWLVLSLESIESFISIVGDAYKTSFEQQYSGFVVVGDFLVERRYIRTMYDSFVNLFPFVHSLLARTVSSPRACGQQVNLSFIFDEDEGEDSNHDATDAGIDEATEDESLTTR